MRDCPVQNIVFLPAAGHCDACILEAAADIVDTAQSQQPKDKDPHWADRPINHEQPCACDDCRMHNTVGGLLDALDGLDNEPLN